MNETRPLLNPYFELWRAVTGATSDAETLGTIRRQSIWACAWAVPSNDAVLALADWAGRAPLIELGAGSGYWSWMLAQAGARVRAFDRAVVAPPRWFSVEEGGAEVLSLVEHAAEDSTLLLCWPPLDEPLAAECLAHFRGRRVAYVGEWRGRTADGAFHDRLEREFAPAGEWPLPHWPGYRDSLRLFAR